MEHYTDIDDDESQLRAAIFQSITGVTVEEVLDENERATPPIEAINHLNYPDNDGCVYCRTSHGIKPLAATACFSGGGCPLCYGSLQGEGVECFYSDIVNDTAPMLAITVKNPRRKLERITELINKRLIPLDPME